MPKISDERKAATRRRLVDAAVEVIVTNGPAAATTREILKRAGLSAGALYHYFPSKDELYEAIAHGFVDHDASLPVLAPDATVEQAMDHHCIVMATLFAPGNHSILGQLRVAALTSEPIREGLRRFDAAVVARSAENNRVTQKLGLFRSDIDAEAIVEVVSTFFEGFVVRDPMGFAIDRSEVLGTFGSALAERILDPTHPAAPEFRRRLLEALR